VPADLPPPGVVSEVATGVRRILAPNPGPMTGPGTNTYLVGQSEVAVVDPGPDEPAHLDAVAAAGGGAIRWILVTHHHSDHAPGASALAQRTGATVLGRGGAGAFRPGMTIDEGHVLRVGGSEVVALHTPGHASDHLCYLRPEDGLLFSGDHVMDGSTVVIAPPDGDMASYMDGLRRLAALPGLSAIAPGHGALITEPYRRLASYLDHRLDRERAVLHALDRMGRATVEDLVAAVYTDVPDSVHPVARFSVWAHLRKLADEGRAAASDPDDVGATWRSAR